ncbi:MAG TPA: aminomethyl-transferring glycine dehydrogenase [Longimicrobiales bacterium]|nr:aminomethyl-transferring glycine dehydrogenase [Longimicrobiales bacterium]
MQQTIAPDRRGRLDPSDPFVRRHVGPGDSEIREMLAALGYDSLDALIDDAIPADIRLDGELDLPDPATEWEMLRELRALAARNRVFRSYLGMGYNDTIVPPVIQRNVLENPGWYTAYTPYQAEIAQGRLEALLNYQTMVIDLTGFEIANASLLDEGTAAAEAMALAHAAKGGRDRGTFFVSEDCHPQTIDVVRTRAGSRGWDVAVGDHRVFEFGDDVFGALIQYPASDGAIYDYRDFCARTHAAGSLVIAAADLLSLALLTPPAEWGADVAVGTTQRFGVPLGYGGPHAAYFATKDEFKRQVPGRIIGVSIDKTGAPALRMALQTREQHIRREKATSNVCTAQVLLAVIASFYAVYHGPEGLKRIAGRVHHDARVLRGALESLGIDVVHDDFFDTLRVESPKANAIFEAAARAGINLRRFDDGSLGVALDETVTAADLADLVAVFAEGAGAKSADAAALIEDADTALGEAQPSFPEPLRRTSDFMTHPVFHAHRSETEMMRYVKRLEARDLSLVHSMIPLGSCTMKLNAAAEMLPVTWPAFSRLHPFVPADQAAGYHELFDQLEAWLAEITGFARVSLQPNAGSQGEFAGLMVIRAYHDSRGEAHRDVCLIPQSAHGTNPASAVMAGMRVVVVHADQNGNIDVDDLERKATEHADDLAALMVTYPSTHGIFEPTIRRVCDIVHGHGGQVYLDGANMNAMVGLARPGDFGADVCHLNLHKTFCIPHGGGGPGMGPIGVAAHLAPFLPGHAVVETGGERAIGAISAAPWGSPEILPISWAYIRMLGAEGLTQATRVAILNANYIAHRLEGHYPVLYRGPSGLVAHECIIDPRALKASAGVEATDIAKRLIDYGFHAPTVSFPVAGTLMIEPTESESLEELDRFCDALIAIRAEIAEIEDGSADRADNLLLHAPHTAAEVVADAWAHPYSRERAAFPTPWVRQHKFWPPVARVESAYGDRNLVCACPPIEDYAGA